MKVRLVKRFGIEAAHKNPSTHDTRCHRLHGHSYEVDVVGEGPVDPESGWLIDYGDIALAFEEVHQALDHRCLNDVAGLEDTTLRALRKWIKNRLEKRLPHLSDIHVSIVGDRAFRTALLDPDPAFELPARIGFSFEAAHHLPKTPEGHKCRRVHGHSFRVELGATDLDRLGKKLDGIYDALDHRDLNAIPGLENATSENLCRWMWDRLAQQVDGLRVVVVQETCTARCIYYGR